tara:strand:- start:262 stop:1164 length:903 start_codon:yes stop_codon:yes gene_type:complete
MKNINLKKRYSTFKKNFKKRNFQVVAPFLYKFKLDKSQLVRIENAALLFLNAAFKFKKVRHLNEISKNIIRENYKNISTSGIIVPKNYSSIEYNLFMSEFYKCIDNLGINIDSWYTSLPVRIKFGNFIPNNFSIQDSSTLHVDSPTGFSTNCFAVFYNICGDIKNNYIKYWKFKKNVKEIPFSLIVGKPTKEKLRDAMQYIEPISLKLGFGEILVADNLIYHQTVRNHGCGNRISIDNLCEPKFVNGKDIKSKYRQSDLVKTKKLLEIGKEFIYHYPHNDTNFKKTYGLRSPAQKKEVRF